MLQSSTERLRQEDHCKYEASLDYTVRLLSPSPKKRKKKRKEEKKKGEQNWAGETLNTEEHPKL